ncbi:MAG: ABC transporter permease [Candidatus Hydrogenedentes bacterium]|nr:ABC transporter permease [Candidatus Hydrogenedentota bacterium]
MGRIFAVAVNTYRESIRDKVLYVLLFFAIVVIIGSKAIGWISIGQDIKIVKDLSLASISVFGALISIFVGTNLVYKEIDKRTIYTIISQPMPRYQFVIGKYLGLCLLITLMVTIMSLISGGYIAILGGEVNYWYFVACFLLLIKLFLVNALALLFSTLSSPILGAIMVFCFYIFGHATGIFLDLPPHIKDTPVEPILKALYYILPNFSNFDIRAEVVNGVSISMWYVVYVFVYGILYSALFVYLGVLMFENKDV